MKHERALFVVGEERQTSFHHRGIHIESHLSSKFDRVDVVSITNMYDGPRADAFLKKAIFGVRDMFWKTMKVVKTGNVVNYTIRFPYWVAVIDYLFRDIWSYISLRNHLDVHYDLCVLAHPRLAFIGIWLRKIGHVDLLIYDDWDYYPSHRPGGLFYSNIMRLREWMCVRSADGVVSVSHSLLELRRKQGAKRSIYVPNGVDYGLFSKAQIRAPHPPTILFMGKLDEAWGADLPIKALPIIRQSIPDIRYLLLGEGPDENNLHALAGNLGLENCVFLCGLQEYSLLPHFLAQADLGVATYRNYEFVRLSRPLKIIEYMAAGLPVIATRIEGEIRHMMEDSGAGETIEFSPAQFARVTVDILSNQQKYQRYCENAVEYSSKMDWERLLDREFAFVEELAGS